MSRQPAGTREFQYPQYRYEYRPDSYRYRDYYDRPYPYGYRYYDDYYRYRYGYRPDFYGRFGPFRLEVWD